MKRRGAMCLVAAAAVATAACQRDAGAREVEVEKAAGGVEPMPEEMREPMPGEMRGMEIGVASQAPYGPYLVDGQGRTLYIFTADQRGVSSACYDQCAQAWPPVLTEGDPEAVEDPVQQGMLGMIRRRDGSMQVTYGGWPLYYFERDTQPGQIEGQDVQGFGGEWYLMGPGGEVIREEPGAPR